MTAASRADTVLITGANAGLGLEFTKEYAVKGWDVIATHRRTETPESLAKIMSGFPKVRVERMDVADLASVEALSIKLKGLPVDVLINNAGIYSDRSECQEENCGGNVGRQSFGSMDYELFDRTMAVNVRGAIAVSEYFIDNVRASKQKKIIALGSINGSLTGPIGGSGGISYRSSKAALHRAFQLIALEEEPEGVTVVLFHPGAVLTDRQLSLFGANYPGSISPETSVNGMIQQIEKVAIQDAGRFIQWDGSPAPW
jgi:NAD(P)-dependent dehydrogenase (short-subunit alcohol dehydrogenase family)